MLRRNPSGAALMKYRMSGVHPKNRPGKVKMEKIFGMTVDGRVHPEEYSANFAKRLRILDVP